MVSRRYRANRSVGNKLNNLNDKVTQQQKTQQVTGTQTNAVTNDSIAPEAVNSESVANRAITTEKIGVSAVTSENLGALTEIVSAGDLTIDAGADGHVRFSGAHYVAPYDGLDDALGLKTIAFDPTDKKIKVLDATPPAHDGLRFDTTYTGGSTAVGMLSWDSSDETLEFMLNSEVTLQVGQEHLIRVKNSSGTTAIPDMTAVMFVGATGDTVTVSPATATGIRDNPHYLVGITTQSIAAGGFGFVTQFGFVNHVNTGSWSLGDLLYLKSSTTTGELTTSIPSAPYFKEPIAAVTRVQSSSGRILVRMTIGTKVEELQNVNVSSIADGDVLQYNSTNARWQNSPGTTGIPQSATTGTGTLALTDAGKHLYITGSGQTITVPDNTAVTFPIGTAISVVAGTSTVTIALSAGVSAYQAGLGALTTPITIGPYGMGTFLKVATNTWYISGIGVKD